MQKLLFIGHTYHLKTKSSVFLLEMLKEAYDVSELYMDPDKPYVYSEFEKFSDVAFDVLVSVVAFARVASHTTESATDL